MKLSVKYLESVAACEEGIKEFSEQPETDAIKILWLLIQKDRLDWCGWLLVRLLNRIDKIRYAVFAAEQGLGLYEKKYPEDKRLRMAIEAAKKVMVQDTSENRNAARAASYAASYAPHAAAFTADAACVAASYAALAASYAASYAVSYASSGAALYAADAANAFKHKSTKTKILKHGITLLE